MSSIASGTTTTTGLVYTSDTTGNLVLQTNGTTTAVTIDTSQNVGVGVTPYASWSSFGKAVQLGSTGVFAVASGGSNTNLADNWQTNGSADYYITTNYATRYKQTSGQHQWFVAPSGSAGGAITFTQAMTLDNSGNLLVGATSPSITNVGVQLGSGVITGSTNKIFYNSGYASASGAPSFGGNWVSSGNWGIGPDSSSSDNTVRIAQIGSSGGLWNWAATYSAIKAGAYTNASDYRLKENVTSLESGVLEKVNTLNPVRYNMIRHPDEEGNLPNIKNDIGFLAHELQFQFPEFVTGYKAVSYTHLTLPTNREV